MRSDASESALRELLSPEEVANTCHLSRRAVYRAIARGELQAARLCHRLRIRPADVERWISAHAVSRSARPASRPARSSSTPSERGSLRAMLDRSDEEESDR